MKGWKNNSYKHGLASRGIKTVSVESRGIFSKPLNAELQHELQKQFEITIESIDEHANLPELYRDSKFYVDTKMREQLLKHLYDNSDKYKNITNWGKSVGIVITLKNRRNIGIDFISSGKNKIFETTGGVVRRV